MGKTNNQKENIKLPTMKSITTGASVAFIGRIISAAFGYVNLVLAARMVTDYEFGLYSFFISMLLFAYIIANVGIENTILSLLPKRIGQGEFFYRNTVLTGLFYVLIVSVGILLLLLLATPIIEFMFKFENINSYLAIMLFTIPFQSIIVYFRVINQANFYYVKSTLPEHILRPIMFFLLLIVLYLFQWNDFNFLLWSYFLSFFVAFVVAVLSGLRTIFPLKGGNGEPLKLDFDVVKVSLQFLFIGLLGQAVPFITTIIMGIHLQARDIGYFRAAEQTSALIVFTLISVNMVLAPLISSLYAKGDMTKLHFLYKSTTKWILATSGLFCIIVIAGSKSILSVFGDSFARIDYILQILAIGQLVNAATGSCGYILMMSGKQKIVTWLTFVQVLLVSAMGWYMISSFELVGAALAVSLGTVFLNLSLVYIVWKKFSIHPFSKEYSWTIGILFVIGGLAIVLEKILYIENWFLHLTVIVIFIIFTFFSIFIFKGLEKEEWEYIRHLFKKIRSQ